MSPATAFCTQASGFLFGLLESLHFIWFSLRRGRVFTYRQEPSDALYPIYQCYLCGLRYPDAAAAQPSRTLPSEHPGASRKSLNLRPARPPKSLSMGDSPLTHYIQFINPIDVMWSRCMKKKRKEKKRDILILYYYCNKPPSYLAIAESFKQAEAAIWEVTLGPSQTGAIFYFNLGIICRSDSFCLQHFMPGRVSPIRVHASDSTAMLPGSTLDYFAS